LLAANGTCYAQGVDAKPSLAEAARMIPARHPATTDSFAARQTKALARAARNPSSVAPGQRWQNWDSRYRRTLAPRYVTVLAVEGPYAIVADETGAQRRIRLDRFRPSSTGYKLVAG
jgi:hypothetical protein